MQTKRFLETFLQISNCQFDKTEHESKQVSIRENMNRDLDPRREPAVDVESYVVEFMAQYMIRVLHILRGSLER